MKTTELDLSKHIPMTREERISYITGMLHSLTLFELEELQTHIKAIKDSHKEKCPR